MKLLRRFLVPLDGSLMAEAALPVAFGLARPLGATVTLLYVRETAAPRTVHGQRHLQTAAEAEAYLSEVTDRWRGAGVSTAWHVHPNPEGDVARSLVEHASELAGDVLVMTTHGSGGLRDLLFGSIAQQVLRRGSTPTLIVRPPAGETELVYTWRSILVPESGGHDGERARAYASEIAGATGATLNLLTVVPTVSTVTGDQAASATFSPTAVRAVLEAESEEASRALEGEARVLRDRGIAVTTLVVRGAPVEQIIATVGAEKPDLVVLTTHGQSGIGGTLSGSKAARLIAEIRQPTLLIRVERDLSGRETAE